MRDLLLLLLVLMLLGACGSESAKVVQTVMPLELPLTCAAEAALLDEMQVRVLIGGNIECTEFEKDSDGSFSITCPDVTIGILRGVLVVYEVPESDAEDAAMVSLALNFGAVDLARSSVELGEGDEGLKVDLQIDGIVYDQSILDALTDLSAFSAFEEYSATEQEELLAWFQEVVVDKQINLDRDADCQWNLEEACSETLLTEDNAGDCSR